MTDRRALKAWRFGSAAAWLRRLTSPRRAKIREVRDLYQKLGLVDKGCAICGQHDYRLLATGDRYGFDLNKQFCSNCGLVQTNPRPSAAFHQEFYSHHYRKLYTHSDDAVDYPALMPDFTAKARDIEALLATHLNGALNQYDMVEIGCSAGGILHYFKDKARRVYGSDLDGAAVAYGRDLLGLDLVVGELPVVKGGPNVFIVSHVLEHVFDPKAFIQSIRNLMGDEDILYVAVPGINMVAKGSYRHDLRRYFHIAHVQDFSMATLLRLMDACGFTAIHCDETVKGLFVRRQGDGKAAVPRAERLADIVAIDATRPRRLG